MTLRSLGGTLYMPGATFRNLHASAPLGRPLLVLGFCAAGLMVIQSLFLEPILRQDPLFTEMPADLQRTGAHLWLFRILSVIGAPAGLAARSLALASILYTAALWLKGRGSWRALLSLVLHLESVFVLETLCMTVVLSWMRPESYEALQHLRLRAGLDLFWEPQSAWLHAAFTAGNIFTLWWAALLARGLETVMEMRRVPSLLLALPTWAVAFTIRLLMLPR